MRQAIAWANAWPSSLTLCSRCTESKPITINYFFIGHACTYIYQCVCVCVYVCKWTKNVHFLCNLLNKLHIILSSNDFNPESRKLATGLSQFQLPHIPCLKQMTMKHLLTHLLIYLPLISPYVPKKHMRPKDRIQLIWMGHICVSKLYHHLLRYWLVAYLVPSHYMNKCCCILNWT